MNGRTIGEVLAELAASGERVRVSVTFNAQIIVGVVMRVPPSVETAADVRGRPAGGYDLHRDGPWAGGASVYDIEPANILQITTVAMRPLWPVPGALRELRTPRGEGSL